MTEVNPGMYARVFEDHHEGRIVFEHMVRLFANNPWVPGGVEAARETDRRLGMWAVMQHITTQINKAHDINDDPQEDA